MATSNENNRIIAEFMGYETYEHTDSIAIRITEGNEFNSSDIGHVHTKFHISWDWLMPVWSKINGFINNEIQFTFTIRPDYCSVSNELTNEEIVVNHHGATQIELVYITIIKFIEWYNKQKK